MQLEPKGRLSLGHLESFFEELRKSRSRTLSLGLLRSSDALTPSQADLFDQVCPSSTLLDPLQCISEAWSLLKSRHCMNMTHWHPAGPGAGQGYVGNHPLTVLSCCKAAQSLAGGSRERVVRGTGC